MLTRRKIVVLLLAFLATLPAVTTRLYASDEVQYYAWLRSITFDRDADFENEYRHFYDSGVVGTELFHETFLADRVNEHGRRINFAPVGSAILWSPFYTIGHVAAMASGAPADGYSQPYISAVAYGSACYGFLAVLLGMAIIRRLLGEGSGAMLAILFGTPLLFYIYVTPPFAHANSAFAVSLFLWQWLRTRDDGWRPVQVVLLGAACGLMGMVREQDLFFAAGPALDFLRWAWTADRARAVRAAATGVASVLVAFSPQLLAYKVLNGHFGPTELTARKMTWTSPHAAGVLFSPEHGLFAWTPLVLVAVAGLVLLAAGRHAGIARRDRDIAWIAGLGLVMFALQVYVSGSVESWTVAGAFGQRRFVAMTPLFGLGLAAVIAATRGARAARIALVAGLVLGIWWNLGLMAQFGLHRMDRQRLTLGRNAVTTFVDLPLEAPGLAWRYLTDRASFYQRPPE